MCRKIIETMPELQSGDIVVSNHPAFGGSHRDVRYLPVFAEGSDRPVAYPANRAHHAEMAGIAWFHAGIHQLSGRGRCGHLPS